MSGDIHLDEAILDAMRSAAEARGERLLAVARLPQGVHPYAVFSFIESEQQIEILETSMFWGRIRGKWSSPSSSAQLHSIVDFASVEFECMEGPVNGTIFGAVLIHWLSGSQVICDGGWFTEESADFAELFDAVIDSSRQIYEASKCCT